MTERFRFTAAQRQAIKSAVSQGCSAPHRFDEKQLLRDIERYRKNREIYRPASQRAEALRRAARLARQTSAALRVGDPWGIADLSIFEEMDPAKRPSIHDYLDRLSEFAERLAKADLGERPPSVEFFEGVLAGWFDAGGKLKFSRGSPASRKAGHLGGPLMRYLDIIVGAVMSSDAPTAEGLRKIIERNARFLVEMCSDDQETAAYYDAIQKGLDPNVAVKSIHANPRRRGRPGAQRLATARRIVRGTRLAG
jgi:hypothetical protein